MGGNEGLTGVSALQDQGTGETALLDKTNQAVLSRQLSPFTLVQKAFLLALGTATEEDVDIHKIRSQTQPQLY